MADAVVDAPWLQNGDSVFEAIDMVDRVLDTA
jgi:hypothetical protein